ncbi:hypothetical protein N9450_04580 [Gammaproteobacteria bacterium]|nr:hypothetical protein [Gammaproteobacteria bacterium]
MGKADKRTKFVELAESRTNKIINLIRLLGNLSRRSNYSYTKQDIDNIKKAINQELNRTFALFDKGKDAPEEDSFKL